MSMFMDRNTTNIAKCQIGFIDILVFPLYSALSGLLKKIEVHLIYKTACCEHDALIFQGSVGPMVAIQPSFEGLSDN